MKFVVFTAVAVIGTVSAFANQPNNVAPQNPAQVDEWEYAYLKSLCHSSLEIIRIVEKNKYVAPGQSDNPVSRIETSFFQEAQNILASKSPAALKNLNDYISVNWKFHDVFQI